MDFLSPENFAKICENQQTNHDLFEKHGAEHFLKTIEVEIAAIIKNYWKVSAHLVKSSPVSFCQTCPENDEKMMKIMKKSKIKCIRNHSVSFPRLRDIISKGF